MNKHPMRKIFTDTATLAAVALLTVGCAVGPTGSVTVEGTVAGADTQSTAMPSVSLQLTHHVGTPLRRVVKQTDARIDDLKSLNLRITAIDGGPFSDEFVLAAMINDRSRTESAGEQSPTHLGDLEWVRRHLDKLAVVGLQVRDQEAGQTATRTLSPEAGGPAGAVWLARLRDGDPVVPWTIDQTDGRCRAVLPSSSFVAPPPGQTRDCFDLQTLAGLVLAHVAKVVTEGLDDGPLPVMVSATRHRLSFVPSLTQLSADGAPGFGLIYAADLRVGERGGEGAADATVYIPVGVHFGNKDSVDAIAPGIEAVFDPLGPQPQSAISIARIALAYRDNAVTRGVAEEIRSVVIESLARTSLQNISVDGKDYPAGQAIGLLLQSIAPRTVLGKPLPINFALVALPVNRSATEAALPTLALTLPRVSTSISTGIPLGRGGVTQHVQAISIVRGDGTVVVTSPLDPPGRVRRVTTLSPIQTGTAFELRLLE